MDFKFNKLYDQIITESEQVGKIYHNDKMIERESYKNLIKELRKEFKIRLNVDSTRIEVCGDDIVHVSWDWTDANGNKISLDLIHDMYNGETSYYDNIDMDEEQEGLLNDFEPLNVQKTVNWIINTFIKQPVKRGAPYVPDDSDLDKWI